MAITGGGGDAGGVEFSIIGDASQLEKVLADVRKDFEKTAEAASKASKSFGGGDASDRAKRDADAVNSSLEKTIQRYERLTEASESFSRSQEKILGDINRLEKKAAEFEQIFAKTGELAPPDVEEFINRIRDAADRAREILGQVRPSEGTGLTPDLGPAEKKFQQFSKTVEQAHKENLEFDESLKLKNAGVPQLSAAAKAYQQYLKTVEQAHKENLEFDESLKLKNAGVPQLTKAEKQFQDYQKTVEQATTANRKFDEAQKLKNAGVLNAQLTANEKAIQAYGRMQARAIEENRRFDAAQAQGTRNVGLFGRAAQGAERLLGRFGLTVSGVAVLLGAGFAAGVAGAIQILSDIGQAVGRFIAEIQSVERQTNLTFGASASHVREFADTADAALGRTRQELLATANAFAAFARSINLPDTILAAFSEHLTEIASILERNLPGFKNLEDAQNTLIEAIKGSDDALRKLGVTQEEFVAAALAEFNKLPDSLSETERIYLAIEAASREASKTLQTEGNKETNAIQKVQRAFTAAGAAALDFFSEDAEERFKRLVTTLSFIGDESVKTVEKSRLAFNKFKDDIALLTEEELAELRTVAESTGVHKEALKAIDDLTKAREKDSDALDERTNKILESVKALKLEERSFRANTSALRAAEDAFRNLDRLREDSARNVAESEEKKRRTIEDNAHKEQELLVRTQRATEDAARRKNRAEENLHLARQERALRDEDIEQNLEQARIDVFRANRTAQERLEDFERDSARKIFDLKKRVVEARKDEARDTVEAVIAVENALRSGDLAAENAARRNLSRLKQDKSAQDQLAEAELALAREREDIAIERPRLERAITETRIDGIKKIEKAERDAARSRIESDRQILEATRQIEDARIEAQRAFEDAFRDLNRLEIENNRALRDAQRDVEGAMREAKRSIDDANRSIERMAKDLGLVVTRMRELVQEWQQMNATRDFAFSGIGGFMAGGMARGGNPAIVGEAGPELIIPNSNSTVVSNAQVLEVLREMMGGRGGTSSQTIIVNEVANDPEATAFAVSARLARSVNN